MAHRSQLCWSQPSTALHLSALFICFHCAKSKREVLAPVFHGSFTTYESWMLLHSLVEFSSPFVCQMFFISFPLHGSSHSQSSDYTLTYRQRGQWPSVSVCPYACRTLSFAHFTNSNKLKPVLVHIFINQILFQSLPIQNPRLCTESKLKGIAMSPYMMSTYANINTCSHILPHTTLICI